MAEDERLYRYAERDQLHAAQLLHEVKNDSTRLDIVLVLQRHLIRCIVRTELRVQRLRRRRKGSKPQGRQRISKVEAVARKSRAAALFEREKELLHLLFLWRCFGDGIAFIYQSKYALKHTFYDGDYKAKEVAGFMTEHGRLKRGFAREYRILCSGIKHNVPVVLCDLTNVIRYGDVCALGGADPVCLEVKASRNRNARTSRQVESLRELSEFYVNDGAPVFRGLQNVRREVSTVEEVDFRDLANACIAAGLKTGWSHVHPEPGLTYLACTEPDDSKLAEIGINDSTCYYFLSARPDYHLPSYPFTLSMTSANCVAFMQQRFGLMVFIDLREVKAAFARLGAHATMLMDGTYSVQLTKTPENLMLGVFRASEQMLGRVATEFLSIEWFAEAMSERFDVEPGPPMTLDEAMALPGTITEVPPAWADAVDCWEPKRGPQ